MLLDKLKQPEIEPRVINQDHYIRPIGQYILFAETDIAEYGRQVPYYLQKAHKGKFADMPDHMSTRRRHLISAPAAYIGLYILRPEGPDEVRPV